MSKLQMIKEYYQFMQEREFIRKRKERGDARPWTHDATLGTYKFTNVKRQHDRTTEWLVRNMYLPARKSEYPEAITLLNCALFRFTGTTEMAEALGWHTEWNARTRKRMETLARDRMSEGEIVFTRAYIIPNCGDAKPKYEVVGDIIDQLWSVAAMATSARITTWQAMCELLQEEIRGVGPFTAKEVVLDYILATGWKPTDWQTWTPMGPGARRGAYRVEHSGAIGPMSAIKALEVCKEIYAARTTHWGADQVELDLTDIQFQLCEFDKYLRAVRAEGRPKNVYTPFAK